MHCHGPCVGVFLCRWKDAVAGIAMVRCLPIWTCGCPCPMLKAMVGCWRDCILTSACGTLRPCSLVGFDVDDRCWREFLLSFGGGEDESRPCHLMLIYYDPGSLDWSLLDRNGIPKGHTFNPHQASSIQSRTKLVWDTPYISWINTKFKTLSTHAHASKAKARN